jgi:hypothetical protein
MMRETGRNWRARAGGIRIRDLRRDRPAGLGGLDPE